jgi:ABC-2 type transport system ATP-binding protein
MPQVVIRTEGLSKTYRIGFWKTKPVLALNNLNLEVFENEIFGCLGPNGAGKSTTLKLLMSLIYPTAGRAEILGESVLRLAARRHLGYLPESPYFYEYLTAEEFLTYYGSLFGFSKSELKSRVDHFLKLTDVFHARKLQLRKFSKGMLQRVGIAQAIIGDPKVVFLDEPMSGLDPIGRREVRNLILQLKREGKTIFFSTHILNDVETLCDRIAILNRGMVIGSGTLNELFDQEVSHVEVVISGIPADRLRELVGPAASVSQSGNTLRLELSAQALLSRLVAEIEQASGKIISINPVRQTMEDYFLKLVGKPERRARPRDPETD